MRFVSVSMCIKPGPDIVRSTLLTSQTPKLSHTPLHQYPLQVPSSGKVNESSKRNYFPIFLQPQSPDCQPVGELPQSTLWSLIPALPLGIQSPRWCSLGTESGMGTFLEKVARGSRL